MERSEALRRHVERARQWSGQPVFVDSHVHLDRYSEVKVGALVGRARAAGVRLLLAVSTDLSSSLRTLALCRRWPEALPAVGVHPLAMETATEADLARLEALTRSFERVVAIGEVGLDVEASVPLSRQRQAFRRQALLARSLGLPMVLHVRGAVDALLEELRDLDWPSRRGVVHYFTGDEAQAERLVRSGLLLSVGKPVTRPEQTALRRAVALVPLDRLLLETDSYPLPGRLTEPRDVRLVAEAVAEIKGCSLDEVATATTRTFLDLVTPRPTR